MAPGDGHPVDGVCLQCLRHVVSPAGPENPAKEASHGGDSVVWRLGPGHSGQARGTTHFCVFGDFPGGICDGLHYLHCGQSQKHLWVVPVGHLRSVYSRVNRPGAISGAQLSESLFPLGKHGQFLRADGRVGPGLQELYTAQRHDSQGESRRNLARDCHHNIQHGRRRFDPVAQVQLQAATGFFLSLDCYPHGDFRLYGRFWERRVLGLWECHTSPYYTEHGQHLVGNLCQVRIVFGLVFDISRHDVSHLEHYRAPHHPEGPPHHVAIVTGCGLGNCGIFGAEFWKILGPGGSQHLHAAGVCLSVVFSSSCGGKGASPAQKVYRYLFTGGRTFLWMFQDGENDPGHAGGRIGGALAVLLFSGE
mmetsp:Transcript_2982/g.7040  ORF Transcript_2982/g.7040 Transcript_2982/m.7040 type:complete len:363 (+) Transcript_2982:456-1544(+)